MICGLAPIHEAVPEHRWKLNCRGCEYLGPWAASLLYATFLRGQQLSQFPRVHLPNGPPPLAAFCEFSGMALHFARGRVPDPNHPQCETVPLEAFVTASWDRSAGIIRLLNRHMELDQDSEDQVRMCVQEVTQNIVDHSHSPIGGVLSARYIESSSEVRVGIVDRGVGIACALRRQHPDTTTSTIALSRVVRGGFSSLSRPNNMGIGVSNLFNLVRTVGGRMAVFTGDAYAEVHSPNAEPVIRMTGCDFPGTAVFFSLPIGR